MVRAGPTGAPVTRPSARPLNAEVTSAWRAGRVPWWLPGGLVVGWVAALVISVASDNRPSSTVDPTLCGPDQAFAVSAVFLLATPVLLLWMPTVGCLAGVVFAVADVLFDGLEPARISWGVHGVACAMVGTWLILSRWHQRTVADVSSHAFAPATAHTERWGLRTVVAGLLVLLGAAMLARYAYRVVGEQDHLNRAEATVAMVVGVNDEDYTITLVTRSGQRHTIEVLDDYPIDSRHTVFTDPADPSWIRLAAEPDDATMWETGGLLCLVFAALLWWRAVSARRARAWLLTEAQPALAARLHTDDNGNVLIVAADDRYGRHPLVVVPGACAVRAGLLPGDPDEVYLDEDREPDWEDVAAFGRWWRGEEVVDHTRWLPADAVRATVLGRFAEGDWVAVVTDDAVLLPNGPLRPARPSLGMPWGNRSGAIDRYGAPPGRLATATGLPTVPEPPITIRQPDRVRLVGLIGALAGLVGVPAAILLGLPGGWYEHGMAIWTGGWLTLGGVWRISRRLVLDRQGILVFRRLTALYVPWERIPGVRLDGDQIALAVEPDEVFMFGPLADPDRAGPEARAERVAAVMCWLRERALAAGHTHASRYTTVHPVAVAAVVGYAAVVAAALWWHSRYG